MKICDEILYLQSLPQQSWHL